MTLAPEAVFRGCRAMLKAALLRTQTQSPAVQTLAFVTKPIDLTAAISCSAKQTTLQTA